MEQYIEIKAANPDCLLFYRMGDFYELFFEDAEIAARALGIVLTKRGKHLGRDIPMCGVPVHRSDEYLHRLIAMGHRVAVCEQLEDPAEARKRGGKSVVRRDVIRLVTPGTLTEDTLLDARRNNYLLAIARARASAGEESRFAIAWIDISTGEFRIAECDRTAVAADIARLEPGEIIVNALATESPLRRCRRRRHPRRVRWRQRRRARRSKVERSRGEHRRAACATRGAHAATPRSPPVRAAGATSDQATRSTRAGEPPGERRGSLPPRSTQRDGGPGRSRNGWPHRSPMPATPA
jgi:DNA mismatch repair ATPase MutS